MAATYFIAKRGRQFMTVPIIYT